MEPRYLGDGVYASYKDGMIMLSVGSYKEYESDSAIFLDKEVVKKLITYLKDAVKEYRW